jgi:hypothetical protein
VLVVDLAPVNDKPSHETPYGSASTYWQLAPLAIPVMALQKALAVAAAEVK